MPIGAIVSRAAGRRLDQRVLNRRWRHAGSAPPMQASARFHRHVINDNIAFSDAQAGCRQVRPSGIRGQEFRAKGPASSRTACRAAPRRNGGFGILESNGGFGILESKSPADVSVARGFVDLVAGTRNHLNLLLSVSRSLGYVPRSGYVDPSPQDT